MENFKVALETLVIGALALPWIIILSHFLSAALPSSVTLPSVLGGVNNLEHSSAAMGLLMLAGLYAIGSVVYPLADDLINERHDPFLNLDHEKRLRARVFRNDARVVAARVRLLALEVRSSNPKIDLFNPECSVPKGEEHVGYPEGCDEAANTIHGLLTPMAFANNANTAELLKFLNDQIHMLRGGIFNGLALVLICLVASAAGLRPKPGSSRATMKHLVTFLPSLALLVAGVVAIICECKTEFPTIEIMLFLLGGLGVWMWKLPKDTQPVALYATLCLLGFASTVIMFGALTKTEESFERRVIHTPFDFRPGMTTVVEGR